MPARFCTDSAVSCRAAPKLLHVQPGDSLQVMEVTDVTKIRKATVRQLADCPEDNRHHSATRLDWLSTAVLTDSRRHCINSRISHALPPYAFFAQDFTAQALLYTQHQERSKAGWLSLRLRHDSLWWNTSVTAWYNVLHVWPQPTALLKSVFTIPC